MEFLKAKLGDVFWIKSTRLLPQITATLKNNHFQTEDDDKVNE